MPIPPANALCNRHTNANRDANTNTIPHTHTHTRTHQILVLAKRTMAIAMDRQNRGGGVP